MSKTKIAVAEISEASMYSPAFWRIFVQKKKWKVNVPDNFDLKLLRKFFPELVEDAEQLIESYESSICNKYNCNSCEACVAASVMVKYNGSSLEWGRKIIDKHASAPHDGINAAVFSLLATAKKSGYNKFDEFVAWVQSTVENNITPTSKATLGVLVSTFNLDSEWAKSVEKKIADKFG